MSAAAPAVPAERPPRHARVAGLRVLLVEDNALNRLIASTMLRENGVAVVEAGDGEEAVAIVESGATAFDLVLMDLQMPGISGYEATRRLRKRHDAAGRQLKFKMWAFPYLTIATIIAMAAILVSMAIREDTRSQITLGLISWATLLLVFALTKPYRTKARPELAVDAEAR